MISLPPRVNFGLMVTASPGFTSVIWGYETVSSCAASGEFAARLRMCFGAGADADAGLSVDLSVDSILDLGVGLDVDEIVGLGAGLGVS